MARKFIDDLRNYFLSTSDEQLEKDWNEIKVLNNIGPSVEEYPQVSCHCVATSCNEYGQIPILQGENGSSPACFIKEIRYSIYYLDI